MTKSEQELCYLTIREASRLLETRKLSPVELTRAFLNRIERVDGRIKSYVTLLPESALAKARTAEAEIVQGKYRSPLHGIPLAHKDLYDTKGVRTTAQSKVLEHRIPTRDATAIARLGEAGSVLLGKLAMHEFAFGGPPTSLFEPARNPWNLDCIPGMSSSGSGAAVAAGLCMGSLGSDTGGSIRFPASVCGIVGLMPTYGRVSRYGVIPLSWSLDHCGPMTRTVEDAALMLQAISGFDPKDQTTSQASVPNYSAALRENVKGVTIGVPRHFCFDAGVGVDAEVVAAVEKALRDLEDLGARVQEVRIPSLDYAHVATRIIIASEAFSYHRENLQRQPENFGQIVRTKFYVGSLLTAADYVQAQRARSHARQEFAQAFQRVDVLVMPTVRRPASTFKEYDPMSAELNPSLTAPFNLTGVPALSIPCGLSSKGLPIGMQIAGRPLDEATVLRVAYTYQQRTRWHEMRPPI